MKKIALACIASICTMCCAPRAVPVPEFPAPQENPSSSSAMAEQPAEESIADEEVNAE